MHWWYELHFWLIISRLPRETMDLACISCVMMVLLGSGLLAEAQNCGVEDLNTAMQGPTGADLVVFSLAANDPQGSESDVTILDHNIVCLSTDAVRGQYSLASVVVSYDCTGLSCPDSGPPFLSQFEFSCDLESGWSEVVLGSPARNVQTPPDAGLDTDLRRECALCIHPARYFLTNINHCLACHESCYGLMECTGTGNTNCCNVVDENGLCALSCPSPLVPDSNFTCVLLDAEIAGGALQTYSSGDDISLRCTTNAGNSTSVAIQWLHNNVELVSEISADLDIPMATASSGGEYICIVNSGNGTADASVTIHIRPEFISQPGDIAVRNGSLAAWMCEASSFPPPLYSWGRVGEGSVVVSSSMLFFDPVLPEDLGEYYCNVTSGDITIQSFPATLTVSPQGLVTIVPSTLNGQQGDIASFQCLSQGGPGNSFSWIKLDSNASVVGAAAEISINVTEASDGGNYLCTVTNNAGSDAARGALNVAPYIIEFLAPSFLTSGNTASLRCVATGFPTLEVSWYFNEEGLLLNGSRVSINKTVVGLEVTSTIEVDPVTSADSGNYSCVVDSPVREYNAVMKSIEVLVQAVPEQPQNVIAVATSSRGVILTWEAPHDNNAPITGYEIIYMQPAFVEGERERMVTVAAEMANITGLFPGADYSFAVTAVNDVGGSVASHVAVRTFDEAPASAPGNLAAFAQSPRQIHITWDSLLPIDQNGVIVFYELFSQPLETFGGILQLAIFRSTGNSVTIGSLEEYVSYNISIRAYTSAGAGPFSDYISITTPEDVPSSSPDVFTVVVTSSITIYMTWDPVSPIDQNGVITAYEIQFEPLETFDGLLHTQSLNVSGTVVILRDLEEFVTYNITVRAYTRAGAGPYSQQLTATTIESVPSSPPQNVVAVVDSSTASIKVSWDEVPPIDQNGIIISYVVLYLLDFQQETAQSVTVAGLTVELTNLEASASYFIVVQAQTSIGGSPASMPIIVTIFASASVLSQIEFRCSSQWYPLRSVTTPSDASLTTSLRRRCGFCISTARNINHCSECHSSCVGLMECTFANHPDYCCNVVNELSRCDARCPPYLVPNSSFICVHPVEISGTAIQSYRIGETVSLTCSSVVGPINTIQWLMNGIILVGETTRNLQLVDVTASDGGNYTCEVNNTVSANVTINIRPEFTTQPDNVGVFNGSMITVTCEASAYPYPDYAWTKLGSQPIRNDIVTNSSMLLLNPVLFGDEGDYYCNATSGGVTIQSQMITISVYPLALLPLNHTYSRGDNISLLCSTIGGPGNTIQWQDSSNSTLTSSSTLTLLNVSSADEGVYTCVVSNAAGTSQTTTSVMILPYFTTQPQSEEGLNNSSVAMLCEVDDTYNPVYTWSRVDGRLLGPNTIGRNMPLLMFSPISFGDEGEYICSVETRGMIIQSQSATLSVAPLAMVPTNQTYSRGQAAIIVCTTLGGPDNNFQWLVNGSVLSFETTSALTLQSISAASGGDYTCLVSNRAGSSNVTTSVFVSPYFPSQPQDGGGVNGTMTTLSCVAEAYPNPNYQWSRVDGQKIREGVMGQSSDTLMFQPLLFGDEGRYFCNAVAVTNRNLVTRQVLTLVVSPASSISVSSALINSEQGHTEKMACMAQGGPENTFTWTKLSDYSVVGRTATVSIIVLSASEGDMYQCTVANTAGNDMAQVTLNVAPYITTFTVPPCTVPRGGIANLRCVAAGYPLPSVTWLKDGNMLTGDGHVTISTSVTRVEVTSTVEVYSATSADSGNYSCRVESSVPEYSVVVRSASVAVHVEATPKPTTAEVSTPELTTAEVTTSEPTTTTREPTTPDVTTPELTTAKATTSEPTTPDITTPEPTTEEAITSEPTTPDVITPELTTVKATTSEPTTPAPKLTTEEATTSEPTTPDVTTPEPIIAEVTTSESTTTTREPTKPDVNTPEPTTTEATTSEPTTPKATTPEQPTISHYFQLRLAGVLDCTQWTSTNIINKRAEFIQVILEELSRRCQCNMESSDISSAGFQCFPASPDAVTFRASLRLPQFLASEVIGSLEEWVTSGAVISVQAQLLSADKSCAVRILSFVESECQSGESTTPILDSVSSDTVPTMYLIGVIIAAVVVVLLLIFVVALVIILQRRTNKAISKPQALQIYENVLRDLTRTDSQQDRSETVLSNMHDYDTISMLYSGREVNTQRLPAQAQDGHSVITSPVAAHQISDDSHIAMAPNLSYKTSRHPH